MVFIAFLISLSAAIAYVWNGKDQYNPKDWGMLVLKFFLAILAMIVFGFLLKALVSAGFGMSVRTGRVLTAQVGLSLIFIVGAKLMVVGLCTLFSGLMGFHKKFNTEENYQKLASISALSGAPLLIAAKIMVSLGVIIIYYGIWFGMRSI